MSNLLYSILRVSFAIAYCNSDIFLHHVQVMMIMILIHLILVKQKRYILIYQQHRTILYSMIFQMM